MAGTKDQKKLPKYENFSEENCKLNICRKKKLRVSSCCLSFQFHLKEMAKNTFYKLFSLHLLFKSFLREALSILRYCLSKLT